MGWDTSNEKDSGFRTVARALGVEISMADSAAGLFKICNTEARQKELASCISYMLEQGSAMSKEFEVLRGRLIFRCLAGWLASICNASHVRVEQKVLSESMTTWQRLCCT